MDISSTNQTLVYRFVDVDPEEGLDAKDLSKFLNQFDGLIKEVAKESGTLEDTTIKVRPFKEGSFITEFVIHCVPGLMNALNSEVVSAITNGADLVGVILTIAHIIKKVKGHISKYKATDSGTFEYGEGSNTIVVPVEIHALIQSPEIADKFSTVIAGPMKSFKRPSREIEIKISDSKAEEDVISFSSSEAIFFDNYKDEALKATQEETVVRSSHNIWVRPLFGSYGGDVSGYTFESGYEGEQLTYKKVQIDDLEFLEHVRDGEYRLNSGDLMLVDMTIEEIINLRTQKVRPKACRITKVKDYRPMKRCEQLTFADIVNGENDD